ncbi:vWA domain-containing protein [Roseateles puraquae]|uniref:VWA domain-containing protein n=1 Tax=Roseateles puraquae TaxID=431059 RepID=A0A254N2B2_9BURK|nr:VWA domain-containing protein [Roseateles puraquae]MDG0856976.1 VWA domain-containing protein [Roseateles puraquae]OWQ98162.1 VWA domain-containing protein [Roseateles puraquae]
MRRALLVISLALLAACGKRTEPATEAPPPAAAPAGPALQVLATSDLKDIEPLAGQIKAATGVDVQFRFGGTMESTQEVLSGDSAGKPAPDVAWFANAKYLLSDAAGQRKVKLQEKIMLSPMAVGVSRSDAEKNGWTKPDARLTWADITRAAKAGKLQYALSNPATSNQGFMALLGVVAAAGGKGEALTAADVDRGAIADFLKGYKIVGDNSTYLAEQFIKGQGTRANAFINYESWLLSLNASGKLREPLHLIYPFEGVSTADYPFMLLNDARRADYQKVVDYLKSDPAQLWLARQTLRRPIKPEVAAQVADILPARGMQVELPFSPDRQLADGLIDAYLNEFRRPIASTFVLDTSGSMQGKRREQLVEAIHYLAGADASLTGRVAKLTNRERLWFLPFSDRVGEPVRFEIPAGSRVVKGVAPQVDTDAKLAELKRVRDTADELRMSGGTAMYDAVLTGLQNMLEERKRNPDYQYSVVAFTDGKSNMGRRLDDFKRAYEQLPEDVRGIPVFMVLFGEADAADLKALVEITGGKVFDARKTPLYAVFKDIRAYQ